MATEVDREGYVSRLGRKHVSRRCSDSSTGRRRWHRACGNSFCRVTAPHTPLVIYGNEPWEPYNRVRLASLLIGELNFAAIQNPLKLMPHHRVVQHHDCEIVAIDRANKTVYDRLGNCQRYSQLVLATGSHPHRPSIAGAARVHRRGCLFLWLQK